MVKNLPTMQKTRVQSLGQEDPLENRMEWLSTPVFWPGEFHGLYSPWGRKESDTTERLSLSVHPMQHFGYTLNSYSSWASLVAQTVKNLPEIRETWV